jgi:hypothetical protein
VEILNEARDIRRLRQQADDLTSKLIPAIFNEMFGNLIKGTTHTTLGQISDEIRYGTSNPSSDSGYTTLRIPNVIGDTISYEDLVSVALEPQEAARYILQEGDLLFVRTNGNPDYVGRCGVFDPTIAQQSMLKEREIIFASYLIRVRLSTQAVNPYFVAAYLRTLQGRADILRQAKTSAGQFNINTHGLKGLSIPVFTKELQSKFLRKVLELEELKRSQLGKSDALFEQLSTSLLAYAFSGELTADWRAQNLELLSREASVRDQWLCENGVKIPIPDNRIHDHLDDSDGRVVALNREQRKLLEQIQNRDPDENGGTFTLSSISKTLQEPLDTLSVDSVRRHLDVLVSLGLIKAVSQRAGSGGSVGLAFGNAYRLPKSSKTAASLSIEPDLVRSSEVDRLSRIGKKTLRNKEAFEAARAMFDERSTSDDRGE